MGLLLPITEQLVVTSHRILREQWIRAKYERKEFAEPGNQSPYSNGNHSESVPLNYFSVTPEATIRGSPHLDRKARSRLQGNFAKEVYLFSQ